MFGIAESARLLMLPTRVFIVSMLAVIVVGALHFASQSRASARRCHLRARGGARPAADLEGVRLRLLGGHRRRGDLQRNARLSQATHPHRAAHRVVARRATRRDAARPRRAHPRAPRGAARRRDDPRAGERGRFRDGVGLLRLQPRRCARARPRGEHELWRPARADEHARERQPLATRTSRCMPSAPSIRSGSSRSRWPPPRCSSATGADTIRLIPLFTIGVFVGFTLSQLGLVRHWRACVHRAGSFARAQRHRRSDDVVAVLVFLGRSSSRVRGSSCCRPGADVPLLAHRALLRPCRQTS